MASYYDKFNNGSERALEERLFPLHNRRYQFNNNNNNNGNHNNNNNGADTDRAAICWRAATKRCDTKWTLALCGLALLALIVWMFCTPSAIATASNNNRTIANGTTSTALAEEEFYSSKAADAAADAAAAIAEQLDGARDQEQDEDVQLVRPIKQGPKLHNHDIIYDEMRNSSSRRHLDDPADHLHSGHFRDRGAEVWDPHPEYLIDAFHRKFLLILAQDPKFSMPNLRVIHVWQNYSERINVTNTNRGCYYTGIVKDDPLSHVAVSLCNGMTGYIKTSHENFYISPKEMYTTEKLLDSSLHEMRRLKDDVLSFDEDILHAKSQSSRHKRYVDYDYDDEVYRDDLVYNTHEEGRYVQPQTIQVITKPYFIATMVVADRKMVQYHKTQETLYHYILTLMAHVALLYKDATIGNPITLAVVDIIILRDEEFTSPTSKEILKKFCEFQQSHSRKMHDVALLLTRDVICKNASVQYCTTLGVAEVGSMCQPASSCAIVRDKGLSTSYTIAHELGHVLSMPHDDDRRCQKFHDGTKATNIMSKMLHNDTKPWYWSACSRHFLNEFLNSPKSRCLLDEPERDMIDSVFDSFLPGEKFAVNKQCELEFGSGSQICSFMPYCGSLWCTNESVGESGGCKTQYMPWADGTDCGKDSWCHHGKCIAKNKLSMVAGGWGNWKEWGECSRTCGGGISVSIRECNNPPPANGGPYCIGGSKRYQSCNTNNCDSNPPDFRELQCARFNGQTKGVPNLSQDVVWVPKYGTTNPDDYCKLYCRVKDSSPYYKLSEKVLDGTKCGLNSFDICVNGMCQKGGCDNQLGSNVTLDECGVCGGDNSTCHVVSGFFNASTYGYMHVTLIPRGSSNIRIIQRAPTNVPDDNYLVLKDPGPPAARYLLNGNSIISSYMKDIVHGGLTFKYSGSNQSMEEITSPRKAKLTKDLVVEVLCVGSLDAPNVYYSYTIGIQEAARDVQPVEKWGECDAICNGVQYPVDCSAEECHRMQQCNTHCYLQWSVRAQEQCSSHCGHGFQRVHYDCMKVTNTHQEVVGQGHCHRLPRPAAEVPCTGSCEVHWSYTAWTKCSRSCGSGIQTRSAICVDGHNEPVEESKCMAAPKQELQQSCNAIKCPSWSYDNWAPCSVTCGSGFRMRPYYCQVDNVVYDKSYCDEDALQVVKEPCNAGVCSKGHWETSEWSECSAACGEEGVQRRSVRCAGRSVCDHATRPQETRSCSGRTACSREVDDSVTSNLVEQHLEARWVVEEGGDCKCKLGYRNVKISCRGRGGIPLSDALCAMQKRPKNKVHCKCTAKRLMQKNPPATSTAVSFIKGGTFVWRTSKWNACSKKCGRGRQTRQVSCYANNATKVVEPYCKKQRKPKTWRHCERYNCEFAWVEGEWSACSKSCGSGIRNRTVTCHRVLPGEFIDPAPLTGASSSSSSDDSLHRCNPYEKPQGSGHCLEAQCGDRFRWRTGQWGKCSQRCGKRGRQTRRVYCANAHTHETASGYLCRRALKPPRKQKCNVRKCTYDSCKHLQLATGARVNDDYTLFVSGAYVQLYCYKMDTSEPEEFISLRPGTLNFAEFYDKRLRDPDACPRDGRRFDECDCDRVPHLAGRTMFWKVRLNITSLRIIETDFTFSQPRSGKQVAYGHGGDCYSRVANCIQGGFQVDLTGTSFRFAHNVQWTFSGTDASMDIRMSDVKVMGKCGGSCGSCAPDPVTGLAVQVL